MFADANVGSETCYQSEWENFKRRRTRIYLFMVLEFLAFIPFVGLVGIVERRLLGTDHLFKPAVLLWGALYLLTGSRLRTFPCPRCGQKFFGGFFATSGNFLGNKCASCGLPKWAGWQQSD
jgi:hypothetical protein